MTTEVAMDITHNTVEFLRREIPTRVHRYFPDLSEDFSIEVLHKGQPLIRKHSTLFEISVIDYSRRIDRGLFVKIPKRASEEAVKKMYETLVSLYAFSTQLPEELNVVRPLDYFPGLRAIVTERVDGKRLKDLLQSRRRDVDHGEILKNCGRFLRAYHEHLGQITWQADFAGEFLNQCMAYRKLLENHGIGKAKIQHILSGFERGAGKLKRGVPICLTAKDYNVGNIIVREKQIFFIEATKPKRRSTYDDLAEFLNSLTMLFWKTPRFFLGTVPSPTLGNRFLEGYGAETTPLDLVSLFCAKNLCFLWQRALESLSMRKRGVTGVMGFVPIRYRINQFFYKNVMDHLHSIVA
jgi:hypothetical protein